MGAFFTNVLLRLPSGAEQDVVDTLITIGRKQGYVETDGPASADRTIAVGPAGSEWIAVYDSATESQHTDVLTDLARELSLRLKTHAVTILVHDSDALELSLHDQGAPSDRFNSRPGKVSSSVKRSLRGEPSRWQALLRPGASTDELAEAWKARPLFAEEKLRHTAELMGWEPDACGTGFRYLDDRELVTSKLYLRLKERPSLELDASLPPRFGAGGYTPKMQGTVGTPLQLSFGVRSEGGPGRGMRVVIWGSAIDQRLIDVTEVELARHVREIRDANAFERMNAPVERTTSVDGRALLVVSLDDGAIPPGARGASQEAVLQQQLTETFLRAQVHFNLRGTHATVGRGGRGHGSGSYHARSIQRPERTRTGHRSGTTYG